MDESTLIIHADDAGMCYSVNRAIVEGLENGGITSASIMVPCPGFREFAKFASKEESNVFDFGVHLTLTSEWRSYRWGPVLNKNIVPSLVDKDGFLHRSNECFTESADPVEVEKEVCEQIDIALDSGIQLSHIDSHMFSLLQRPDLIEVYVKIAMKYELNPLFTKQPPELDWAFRQESINEKARFIESRNMAVADRILHFYWDRSFKARAENYCNQLNQFQSGKLYVLLIHPGFEDEELVAITPSPRILDQDRILFTDTKFVESIQMQNTLIKSWSEL